MSSGKFPHCLLDSVRSSPCSHKALCCLYHSTYYLILTFVHCSLFPLNPGLLQVKGHVVFTVHLLTPEQSLARTVSSLAGLPVMCHDKRPESKGRWGEEFPINTGRHVGFCDDDEGDMCHLPEAPSLTLEDEAYPTISSTLEDQLPCGECLKADSGTIPLPQFCSWGTFSESLPPEESRESDSEWEELEEAEDPDDGTLRWVSLCLGGMRLG